MKQNYFLSILLLLGSISVFGQNIGDFRSTASGSWNMVSSWETYTVSGWVAANDPSIVTPVYPGQNSGSYTITIQSGDIITIDTNLTTQNMGSFIVNGTLTLSPPGSSNTISLSTLNLDIDGGILNFTGTKVRLDLPDPTAVITLENGGTITSSIPCNNNKEIYIGSSKYAACSGGGAGVYTFGEVVASGGNVNTEITIPAFDPINAEGCSTINLEGGYTGTETNVSSQWTVTDPNGNPTSSPSVSLADNTATTTYSFTPSIVGEYLVSLEITTTALATNVETRTFNITDTTDPVLTPEANQDVTLNASCQVTIPNLVDGSSATDNCAGVTITQSPLAGSTQAAVHNETINVTVTATDAAGNTDSEIVVITAKDTTNPVLTPEANQDVTLNASCQVTIPNLVDGSSATDNCTGIIITQSPVAGSTQAAVHNGTINVTVTATDAAGNTDSEIVVITAKDTTNPVLTPEANQDVTLNASCQVTIPNLVDGSSATDNCTGIIITQSPVAGSTQAAVHNGTINVTVTATDAAGNTDSEIVVITAKDTSNPTLTPGSNQSANTDLGLCTASVAVTNAVFSDNCPGATLEYTLSGDTTKASTIGQVGTYTFNKGVTTINYTVTDASGNTTTGSKTITVNDNINPSLTAGSNQTANTAAGLCTASVAVTNAVFSDNCPGATLEYTLSGDTTKASTVGQVGTYTFNKGVTTINYTVTDASGNTTTGSKTITVNDNINPTLTAGSNQTANTAAGLCTASVAVSNAVFSDNCPGATIEYTLSGDTTKASTIGQVGTYTFNKGVTTINYTVTDAVGNTTTGSKTVTVTDNINPSLTPGLNQTANTAAGLCTASVNVTNATFSDNCTGATIAYVLSGATTQASTLGQVGTFTFNKGVTTITYTVTDAVGNTTTGSKTVTVTDNINPSITAGANQTANTDVGLCTASVTITDAVFSDNCSGATIAYTLSGANTKTSTAGQVGTYTFNKGVTTINYTVTDAVGRTATASKTITITDNEAPIINCPSNINANVGAGLCTASVATPNPTLSDNCGITKLTWTLTDKTTANSSPNGINYVGAKIFNLGTTTVTYTAYDAANNSTSCSYTVTVVDNIDPVVIAVGDVVKTTSFDGTGNCSALIAIGNASTSDNCSVAKLTWTATGATTLSSPLTGINQVGSKTFNKGITFITYTVTDGSGRTSTDTMTVTVNDNEKPVAPALPDITAQCSTTVTPPIATDNCDGTVTATTVNPLTYNIQGTYTISWTFTDSSGNLTNANQNVIIDDTTAPVPDNNLTDLSFSGCQIDSLTPPTATDNCSGNLNGTPNITFPFTTQGTTVITWTYDDGNGNTTTQTQNITLTAPAIKGGTLLGYLNEIYTVDEATGVIAISSCPDDINPITMNLSEYTGTIIQWEKFEAGNNSWEVIANTTDSYDIIFDYQNTYSTLFRVLVQVGDCTAYSSMLNVHAIPPDVPPILEEDNFTICLNDSVTLVAHNGYTSAVNVDDGGDFNSGQFPDKWDPTQWKIDGENAGAQWTAAGNNTKFNNWSGTNNHPVGTLYRIEYDSNDFKFGIAHGNYNSQNYIDAFGGQPTTLETPIFSLVGLETASIDFDQAYNLHAGDIARLELSLDGGATYTVVLQDLIGTSPHALSWGDTHGAPVPYPYLAPKSNNSTTTYFDFQDDNSSFDISEYIGSENVRIKWTFFGTTDESAWAVDNISIPVKPYSDQLEWTDGIGSPDEPPLASGTIDVAYTFAPSSPGVHEYGATSLINECRAYDPAGTAIATVKVNYSYAGEDISPVSGKCGGTTATLNAYDNTKSAKTNKANGAYPGELNSFSDDSGTGTIGTWSIVSSTGSCGSGSFSDINDPQATFTGTAGTYTLRWTVGGCSDDVQVTLENCDVIDFDGEDDFVNFDNNYNLNNSFTINVWIKPEAHPAGNPNIQSIFSKINGDNLSTTNGYDIRLDNNYYISFNWNGGSSIKASDPIDTSRWYHISVTYDGTTYKIYIDGIEVASAAGSAPITNNYDSILGAMHKNGNPNESINYYSGWMDELQIWDTALTPDQLHQLMNQRIEANGSLVRGAIIPIDIYGLTWANLQAYYRLENLSCGDLLPYSGKGVNGRLMNINTLQSRTAPLPYTTIRDGDWKDRGNTTTPWLYGDTVWDYPNSTGINGDPIDWNIVVQSNNLNSDDKDITLLGLITNAGTELKVVAPGTENENNTGHMLWLTHYLKLDGFIDLIGESQLIQKRYYTYPTQYSESIFDDDSSGYIEIDQQGHKNSYNYNYWSSPVSIQGGANNSPYNISSVLRDGTDSSNPKAITFGDGAYFADGPMSSPFKISNRWLWSYSSLTPDSNSEWDDYYQWVYKSNTGFINAGEGFTMKGSGGVALVTDLLNHVFTGKPNSGTINLSLSIDQTYLIGNPYPCALDADEFIKDNLKDCADCRGSVNSFGGALYFWDHFNLSNNHILADVLGGYATYTLTGGVKAVNDSPLTVNDLAQGTKIPQRYIPVAHGFFIEGSLDPDVFGTGITTSVQGGPIVFKNSQRAFVRESSGNSIFMKNADLKKSKNQNNEAEIDTRAKIRLGFDSPIGSHRQILVGSDPNATNNFDFGYDAPMLGTNDNDMYWELGKTPFIIQAIPNFNDDQIIPLGLKISNEGLSTIKIDDLENIPNSLEIYLFDNETGIYHDIKNSDFKISLPIGEYNKRFSLQFANKTFSIDETKLEEGILVFYNNDTQMLNIKNNFIDTSVEYVSLFNLMGQNIANWKIDDIKQNNIQIPIKNLSSAVYILKIKTDKGEFSKQIIIK